MTASGISSLRGWTSIDVSCTLGPVVGAANFADLERPDLADPGFSRNSADWQTNSNDRSSAARSAKRLAPIDPERKF